MFESEVYGTVKVFSDDVDSIDANVIQFPNRYGIDEADFEHTTIQFELKSLTVIKKELFHIIS